MAIDNRGLNEVSNSLGWPLPNIGQLIKRLGEFKWSIYGIIDFLQSFTNAHSMWILNSLPPSICGKEFINLRACLSESKGLRRFISTASS
jgi:hypothetical protein